MKRFLVGLLLLPLLLSGAEGSPVAGGRVYIGIVADELPAPHSGLLVRAVAPESPASLAGIQPGDKVLRVGGSPVASRRALAEVVKASAPGTGLSVELQRGESQMVLTVQLQSRPVSVPRLQRMDEAVGANRPAHSIAVPEDIRLQIRLIRRRILDQLAALPEGMNAGLVTDELQALRDLARDTNAGRSGWMSGRAGEITIRFRDAEGFILLRGADNLLKLELYDSNARELACYPINSEEERKVLPEQLLQRLRRLR